MHSEGYEMQIPAFENMGEKAGERKGEDRVINRGNKGKSS